jgi:tetratricopeptide (TPR) repeat protein
MRESLRINSTWVRDRLVTLGLTQWWVAEQIGVDRRTVMRWANGQVRSIRSDNAQALADVLDCRLHDLLEVRDAAALGTVEDQRAAARALVDAGVLDRLGPSHQWSLAESLLKATAVRGLPADILGRLYYQLGVACWRQDKLAEAGRHNDAALAIALRSGDSELEVRALGSRATLRWWRGEVRVALHDWRSALAGAAMMSARDRASLHSNLGAALYEIGDVEAGRREIETALALFRRDGTPTQKSIAHAHLALLALDCGDMREAARHARRSGTLAKRADYRRGLALAQLLTAELRAAEDDAAEASAAISRGLAAFSALGIAEATTQRLAGRAWRRLGRLADAADALRVGLRLAGEFPLEQADLHAELALVAALGGQADVACSHADRAASVYARCDAPLKVQRLAEAMSPHVAWRPVRRALT